MQEDPTLTFGVNYRAEGPSAVHQSSQVTHEHKIAADAKPQTYAEAADKPVVGGAKNAVSDPPVPNGLATSELDVQGTTAKSTGKKSSSKRQREGRDASRRANGVAHGVANNEGEADLEKEYDGGLMSTKAPDGYTTALEQDEREKPHPAGAPSDKTNREELVSGRKAGQGWSQSAIRWAPMNVPLQRRLQTLAVLYHALCLPVLFGIFLFLCAIPVLWPLLVPWMLYTLLSDAHYSGKLARRSEWLRRLPVWSLFASYFPARLHRSQELPATRKYVFGYHPHGIISHGAFAAFGTEALGFSQLFPGITNTLLTLESNFRTPLYRDYALAMGLASVSRESCENILSRGGPNNEGMGRAITIVVGGARESLDAQPNHLKLVLKRRKGFVKLAIRNGADLVPVLGFGENELYEQFQPELHPVVHKMQLMVKQFLGFTVPLFHARGVFNYDVGLMPYRRPLNIVVGRPIQIQQDKKPSQEYVDEVHEKYINELLRIWDEWKDTFARDREEDLDIVE